MKPIFFSCEAYGAAAIMRCLDGYAQRMKVQSLDRYCDALDSISVIPWSMPREWPESLRPKDRSYISWVNRYADIRLEIVNEELLGASFETQMTLVKENIIRSLTVVKQRCDKRRTHFELELLLHDVFPPEGD